MGALQVNCFRFPLLSSHIGCCCSQDAYPQSDSYCDHTDPEYAAKLIKHAKQMLEFGLAHPGSYMKSKQEGLKDHSKHYPSSNYNDEMAWGALWLHIATEVIF